MRRLRNQLTLAFLGVVGTGILGATFFTTRAFISDSRNYIMELGSTAAPSIASAISRKLEFMSGQFGLMDEILATKRGGSAETLARSAFQRLEGVTQLDVYEGNRRIVRLRSGNSTDPDQELPEGQSGEILSERQERWLLGLIQPGKPTAGLLLFSVPLETRTYLAWIEPSSFSDPLDGARSLAVSLISEDGAVLASNSQAQQAPLEPEQIREMVGFIAKSGAPGVVARELASERKPAALTAAAPLAGVQGALVLTHASGAQLAELMGRAIGKSLFFVALILAFAAWAAALLARAIARPLEELTKATAFIAEGKWRVPTQTRRRDEIGRLFNAFTRMGRELETRENALQKAQGELVRSERLAALGKFSAGIAHEVKNPLSSILGYAQLLQRKSSQRLDENGNKYLGFIQDETRRASRIISDLLMFARQKPPALVAVKLVEVLDRAHAMLEPMVQAIGGQLEKCYSAPDAQAALDRDQLHQVLLNLVTNSVHALEKNLEGKPRLVRLELDQDATSVELRIVDTGAGISAENLARLFEPFFSTKEVGKGSGLGLSLCHGIVTQHGGSIEPRSVEGEGTTFVIRFPRLPQSQ